MTNQLIVQNLSLKGYGLAKQNNTEYRIWNSLPGEIIEFESIKKKNTYIEGYAKQIISPSKYRIPNQDPAFLSTCPWQIMQFNYENQIKLELYKNLFSKSKKLKYSNFYLNNTQISHTRNQYNYRSKMEFSFYGNDNGIFLSFHKRGTKKGKIIVNGSTLASQAINYSAQKIIQWINTQNFQARDYKTLVIRSNEKNEAIAALFIREKLNFSNYPQLDKNLVGFQIYYSNPKSPASVPTELIQTMGISELSSKIGDIELRHGVHSFFQVNRNVFNLTLEKIESYIAHDDEIIDYYSGVGSISLPLHRKYKSCILIEENPEAIHFAKQNISQNSISNCIVNQGRSENFTDLITKDKVIFFDPPREGLHKNIIQTVLNKLPEKIIYLSCNPKTQLRDLELLSPKYKIEFIEYYNYFPGTPHLESLVILHR